MLTRIDNTFGEPTTKIFAPCYSNLSHSSSLEDACNYILVFEPLKKISLKGKIYDYSQITSYSVSVNPVVSSTKTSMGSALGRAAIGGALFGGVGAIIGASTAKTKTEYENKTTFTIFTNSLSEPSINLDLILQEKETIARIEGVLRIITAKSTTAERMQDTPLKKKLGIGDIATITKDKREVVVIGIEEEGGKTRYQCMGDDGTSYYSEEELE